MLLGLLLLTEGCQPTPVADTAPAFAVRLAPVVPRNQEPFAALDELELVVDPEGAATSYVLDVPLAGEVAETPQLPPLEGVPIEILGRSGGVLAAWGRTPPVTASRDVGDAEAALLFANVGATAWLGDLAPGLYRPAVAALGEGTFFIAGGATESLAGGATTLDQSVAETHAVSLLPPIDGLGPTSRATLPSYTGAADRATHTGRYGATLTTLAAGDDAGKLLLVGGAPGPVEHHPDGITRDVALYDPLADSFAALGGSQALTHARVDHVAVASSTGAVVVAGGWQNDGSGVTSAASIEVYDPTARSFSGPVDVDGMGGVGLVAAQLAERGVVVCGGAVIDLAADSAVGSNTCVVVDNALQVLADEVSALPVRLVGSVLVRLENGDALLAGGAIVDKETSVSATMEATSYAWILREGGYGWSRGSTLSVPRAGHAAELLPDGRVVLVGGAPTWSALGVPAEAYACADVFDPVEGEFSLLGDCAGGEDPLASPTWRPATAVDPLFGALVAGGALLGPEGPTAAIGASLLLPDGAP